MVAQGYGNQVRRPPGSANLYDVLELILDKGIVIDAFVRVSLVGIELLTVDLRVVIASVDTYLRYAEAVERMGLWERTGAAGVDDVLGKGEPGTGRAARGIRRMRDSLVGSGREAEPAHDEGEPAPAYEGGHSTLGKAARSAAGAVATAAVAKGVERALNIVAQRVEGRGGSAGTSAEDDEAFEDAPMKSRADETDESATAEQPEDWADEWVEDPDERTGRNKARSKGQQDKSQRSSAPVKSDGSEKSRRSRR